MKLILLHLKAIIYPTSCQNLKLFLAELIDYQIISNNYWRLLENPNSNEKPDRISLATPEAQHLFQKNPQKIVSNCSEYFLWQLKKKCFLEVLIQI